MVSDVKVPGGEKRNFAAISTECRIARRFDLPNKSAVAGSYGRYRPIANTFRLCDTLPDTLKLQKRVASEFPATRLR
jgi:hypothetical protein